MNKSSDQSGDELLQCDRCDSAPAFSEVRHGADTPDAHMSSFKLCEDCVRSFGEWFEEGDSA